MSYNTDLIADVNDELYWDPKVSSWAEHDEANDAAWAAPGVSTVHDHLTVAY